MKYLGIHLFYIFFLFIICSSVFIPSVLPGEKEIVSSPILYPGEYRYSSDLFPAQGQYISTMGTGVTFANSIMIRNMIHHSFTSSFTPPAIGVTQNIGFNATTDFEMSIDGGSTWTPQSGTTTCMVQMYHARDSSDVSFYDIEMLQMDVGGLVSGIMIRESPTKQSLGIHKIRTTSDNYFINSFFDVFFEISTDFGTTFSPALSSWRLSEVSFLSPKPWVLTPSDMFPPNGKYASERTDQVSYPAGVVIRNFVLRKLDHSAHLPPLYSSSVYSFSGIADFEISLDGGSTFNLTHAPATITVRTDHIADSANINLFSAEMLQLDIMGGDLNPTLRFRESPTKASGGKILLMPDGSEYQVNSFFDIFTELSSDGGSSWSVSLDRLSISLTYPTDYPFPSSMFPPDGYFSMIGGDTLVYPPVLMMKNVRHRNFSSSVVLPDLGLSVAHSYTGLVDFDFSVDGGLTFTSGTAPASYTVQITHVTDDGMAGFYNVELTSMMISGGNLPSGCIIRESPTRASVGEYNVQVTMITNTISSFFDVYTELTVDGGMSWTPANRLETIDLIPECSPITILPPTVPDGKTGSYYSQTFTSTGGLPPYIYSVLNGTLPFGLELASGGKLSGTPTSYGKYVFDIMATDSNNCTGVQNYVVMIYPPERFTVSHSFPQYGKYVSPPGFILLYPQGIALRNIVFDYFSPYVSLPPLQSMQLYQFSGTIDCEISLDGGQTWQFARFPNITDAFVNHSSDDGDMEYYSTELSQFNCAGGDLPAGVLIRESPTLSSLSKMYIRSVTGGYMVSSFFDVLTELSVDGGQTWAPALAEMPMELRFYVPKFFANDSFPNGKYSMEQDDVLTWPMGIKIRNAVHHDFDPLGTLPASGLNQIYNFTGIVTMELSLDGGLTWGVFDATEVNNIRVDHVADENNLALYTAAVNSMNIAGGTLPSFIMIRESPTKASIGETNVRTPSGGYKIDSFFDIFLEMSLDGGLSWATADHPMKIEIEWDSVERTLPVASGWNMISVPLEVENYLKTVLFPGAISSAFAYEGTYIEKDTLSNSLGYWIKFSKEQTIGHSGYPRLADTIDVSNGWNMIGGLSEQLAVTDISSNPPGIVTSNFFGYEQGYAVSDSLLCGKGYWVKVERDGQLILAHPAGSGLPAGQITILPTSELPPAPPDGRGALVSGELPESYSLGQNYPNPFNPLTMITYALPEPTYVKLSIFNMLGQEVKILIDGMQNAGYTTVEFRGDNLPSGMYTYRIVAGTFTGSRKMILIK